MSRDQIKLGSKGEELAIDYLKSNQYSILEKNFDSKYGEIDIIAEKNHCLYFVEVKTRSNLNYGQPYEAVTKWKISHIKRASQYYLLKNNYSDYRLKIAVFSIVISDRKTEIKFWDDIES